MRGCRWIIGEVNGGDTVVCGKRVPAHGSWCSAHTKKVFMSKEQRIKERAKVKAIRQAIKAAKAKR